MYFWNVDKLVQELRAGTLSEYEKMKYLLASILLQIYALSNTRLVPQNLNQALIGMLIFGVMVGVTVWGVYHCFIINKQNDNKNFIERFVCLGFPIGVRLAVFTLAGLFITLLIAALLGPLFLPYNLKAAVIQSIKTTSTAKPTAVNTINLNNVLFVSSVLQVLVFVILSLIYYTILGRKIAEVSKKE